MTIIKGIVLTVLVATLISGYYWATEPVRYLAPAAPPPEVRRNPYLAAQTLLHNWHQPTRQVLSTAALFPLPAPEITIIMDGTRGQLGADRIRQLLAWVHSGGHLVLGIARLPADVDTKAPQRADPLLRALGLHMVPVASADQVNGIRVPEPPPWGFTPADALLQRCLDNPPEKLQAQCDALTCRAPARPDPALFKAGGQIRALQTAGHRALDFQPSPDNARHRLIQISNADGNQLIQLQDGKGRVTAITDLSLWDNDHLHYFDHAWLLKHLAGGEPVWFVRGIDVPPLPLWLWEHAWPLLLALSLALVGWLWRRLPRLGPVWTHRPHQQTDYLGHLSALGHFHWRLARTGILLAPLREQARQQLLLLHPDPDRATSLAAQRLAEETATVNAALNSTETTRDPQELIRQVTLLRRLTLLHGTATPSQETKELS